jgi:type IV fimbrial biogenesis protein FimT
MKKQTGFTLVELMVTLFIVAILAGVGVPALKTFMRSNQLVAASNELVSALHVARSESIKLNKKVTVCVSSNGITCLNNEKWQKGWIVFVDTNGDRLGTGALCKTDTSSDCILRRYDAVDGNQLSITGKLDSNNADIKWFTFTSRGMPKDGTTSVSGKYSVCSYDDNNNVIGSRAVVLGLSGRVRITDNAAIINCPASP